MSKTKTKSTNTSASTSNSTTTPTVAPWLSQGYQDLSGQIGNYAQTNPNSYVTGPNATQTSAFNGAQNLGGWQQYLGQGAGLATNVANASGASAPKAEFNPATAATASGYVDSYMNPYLAQVVDTTLKDYDVNSGRTRADQAANAAKNQAFGGSRYAIREAQTEGELARGRASTESNLRAQAYQAALAAAQSDADRAQQTSIYNSGQSNQNNQFNVGQAGSNLDRQLSAAGVLGQFGNSMAANQQGDVATQLAAGGQQRDIAQQQATALPDWLKSISDLYGSIPINAFTSLNNTGTSTGNSTGSTTTIGGGVNFSPTSGFSFGA